jgi:pyrroline-5-carboxylate reductase
MNNMIGLIGAGNMGSALIAGIVEGKKFKADQLVVSDIKGERAEYLAQRYHVRRADSNQILIKDCGTIILAVKPKEIKPLLKDIKNDVRDDHLLISIAAGVPTSTIRDTLQRDLSIVRVMPNTPAMVRMGITAISPGPFAEAKDIDTAVKIFSQVGETVIVDEELMDAVTALSGSGPGYIFLIMEALVDAGIRLGLKKEIALALAIQTTLGTAQLARESKESLAELRDKVTSPGGTTAKGLAVMSKRGLTDIIIEAVEAACRRSKELSSGP